MRKNISSRKKWSVFQSLAPPTPERKWIGLARYLHILYLNLAYLALWLLLSPP